LAGKYRIERQLGSGGMGQVYEAVNSWTQRRVAIKLLHSAFSADAALAARFMREAQAASRIAHPNVVDVLDLGKDPDTGSLYMVQEFLVGETLRERLMKEKKLSPRVAAELLVPILAALETAHRSGVIHRDLKPENIFLCRDAGGVTPKLIDFGISKLANHQVAVGFSTQEPIGTPLYMSPEQLRADDDVDGRADVWAMGVVLFEALSGQRPFKGKTHGELSAAILTSRAPSLDSIARDVPKAIGALVDRALEPDRTRRVASMSEMLGELLAWAEGAYPELAASLRADNRQALSMLEMATRPSGSPARRKIAIGWILYPMLGLLTLAVALAILRWSQPSTSKPSPSPEAVHEKREVDVPKPMVVAQPPPPITISPPSPKERRPSSKKAPAKKAQPPSAPAESTAPEVPILAP
jgi:serine/threonine-protein kinase